MTTRTPNEPPLQPAAPAAEFSDVASAESWWMRSPEQGTATVLHSPRTSLVNTFSVGTHLLPVRGALPERSFARGEFIVHVLRGRGSASLGGKREALRAGTSVVVGRGIVHTFANEGDTDLELLWVSMPAGYELLIRGEGHPREPGDASHPGGGTDGAAPAGDFFTGPSSLGGHEGAIGTALVVGPDERATYWQGLPTTGSADVIVSPYNYPSNLFSMGTQTLAPGAFIPPHSHSRNDELLFVLEGRGRCSSSAGEAELLPGRALYVGRWAAHGLQAAEDESLTVFWFFTPPGLEVVLAGLGRPRQAGEEAPEPFAPPPTIAQLFSDAGFQPG